MFHQPVLEKKSVWMTTKQHQDEENVKTCTETSGEQLS